MSASRKRRTASTSCSRRGTRKRTRSQMSPTVMETINILDSTIENSEDVVDLTYDVAEQSVVDLTNNDSVVDVEDGAQSRSGTNTASYVVSSDEEEGSSGRLRPDVLSSLKANSQTRSTPGAVSCPVCMDGYSEIIDSGRLMVSTKCGHLFCSQCIRDSLSQIHSCPTCRKKLTLKQYHPIYI